jgi:S1-C subfamily serine protease
MKALALFLLLASPPGVAPPKKPVAPPARPWCSGMYADDFSVLSKESIDLANRPDSSFTYCVRITATYECLSYATDGSVRHSRRTTTSHGTGFAYKRQSAETLLLTNQHVAEYTAVTDDDHTVSGVPAGCKRVSDSLKIVDNERDNFEGDDIPLTRVVADGPLDMAIIKAKAPLNIMPWKIGRSSALRDRNVVEVKGFPLGAFRATVQGRVTSVYDHDDFKDWNHDDFVIDAQLSAGNSGSPVLAVNCQTGAYELVGVFHADYSRGNSLNVVVHVDEVRELMTSLKRTSPTRSPDEPLLVSARHRLLEEATETGRVFLPFGSHPAEPRPREDGALIFSIFPRDFPAKGWPTLVLEDLDDSASGGFGHLDHLWFGNARGLKVRRIHDLDEQDRAALERALDALRRASLTAVQFRALTIRAPLSREATEDLARVELELKRLAAINRDVSGPALDIAERLGPGPTDEPLPLARPFEPPAGSSPTSEGAP